MNLCEPTNRAAVLDAIGRDVRARGNALTAGDVGYRYLFRALAEGGRSDVIFDLNNQSEKPGYGYQLKKGATSLTEAWDARPFSSSQNHFMLGQIQEWFYHDLAGIGVDPTGPGFKKILIRPQPACDRPGPGGLRLDSRKNHQRLDACRRQIHLERHDSREHDGHRFYSRHLGGNGDGRRQTRGPKRRGEIFADGKRPRGFRN